MKTPLFYILSFFLALGVAGCGDPEDAPDSTVDQTVSGATLGACYAAEHCGPGTVCAQFDEEASAGRCYRACYLDGGADECPEGSVCSPIRDGVTSSPSDQRPPDGACVPLVEEPGDIWNLCDTSRDCQDGLQCTQLPNEDKARCLQFCNGDDDCDREGARCQLSLQRQSGSELKACAIQCATDEDCEGDAACTSFGSFSLCTPPSVAH